jgi:hypothetical protein
MGGYKLIFVKVLQSANLLNSNAVNSISPNTAGATGD